jgi:DcuC family C4-dicarboxylate transporter
MMDVLAAVVVVATFYFIIRGPEVRLALLGGGAVLTLAAWKPEAWFTAFSGSMVQAGLLTVILPAIGFTTVVKLAKCDQHLVRLAVGPLLSLRAVVIPAAMLVTLALSTAITSAAGITAAVGVVLIPAMIGLEIHPAMAAAAVIAGTWGATFSPGSPHPALIGDIAKTPVIEVILAHLKASLPAALTFAFLLYLVARLRGEDRGWTPERAGATPKAGAVTEGAARGAGEPFASADADPPAVPAGAHGSAVRPHHHVASQGPERAAGHGDRRDRHRAGGQALAEQGGEGVLRRDGRGLC